MGLRAPVNVVLDLRLQLLANTILLYKMNNQEARLIIAGNTNIPTMINSIIGATIQVRKNRGIPDLVFRHIYIFHTEQSLKALFSSSLDWESALGEYRVSTTSLTHLVTKLEEPNIERFKDLVSQLKDVIYTIESVDYYVDLTGGIAALKSILAILAYVLDIENIYTLEVNFSSDAEERKRQSLLFYNQLLDSGIQIKYQQFPPIKEFDTFGKLNYTEVLRHRQIISSLTNNLSLMLPRSADLEHLRNSLLSGINSRLIGEVKNDPSDYRSSVFSSSSGIEEMANIIIDSVKGGSLRNKTLGNKLNEISDFVSGNPKYFINHEVLDTITKLIAAVRNDVAHPISGGEKDKDIAGLQSFLSAQLASAFLHFTIKALSVFLDQNGAMIDIVSIDPVSAMDSVYYFGFDGDATGDHLEIAFGDLWQDESEIVKRSKVLSDTINEMKKIIQKGAKDKDAVLFATGDNILFKAKYIPGLLANLQGFYTENTGLFSSIGYGPSPKEASIALRLAKSQIGNSVVGVKFYAIIPEENDRIDLSQHTV